MAGGKVKVKETLHELNIKIADALDEEGNKAYCVEEKSHGKLDPAILLLTIQTVRRWAHSIVQKEKAISDFRGSEMAIALTTAYNEPLSVILARGRLLKSESRREEKKT